MNNNPSINMNKLKEVSIWEYSGYILQRLNSNGVICSVIDKKGQGNLITLGWALLGPSYYDNPIFAIAVTPLRYSWRFLEEVPEFVIAVPDDSLNEAVRLCGKVSGRHVDKFSAAGLTKRPGVYVKAYQIVECPINIECKIFTKVTPPHMLLTPDHRKKPLSEQHTIYFAEVVGIFAVK